MLCTHKVCELDGSALLQLRAVRSNLVPASHQSARHMRFALGGSWPADSSHTAAVRGNQVQDKIAAGQRRLATGLLCALKQKAASQTSTCSRCGGSGAISCEHEAVADGLQLVTRSEAR